MISESCSFQRDDISESSSLSSSPERVKRVRGAGRRGRGARGRGAQGSTATTTSRRSGRRRDVVVETTAQIQERQQRELMVCWINMYKLLKNYRMVLILYLSCHSGVLIRRVAYRPVKVSIFSTSPNSISMLI